MGLKQSPVERQKKKKKTKKKKPSQEQNLQVLQVFWLPNDFVDIILFILQSASQARQTI